MYHRYENRKVIAKTSYNKEDPKKNICGLKICKYLKVDHLVTYIQYWEDIVDAISTSYNVSVDLLPLKRRVKHLKKDLRIINGEHGENVIGYLVGVQGHVFLLDKDRRVIIDTAPWEWNLIMGIRDFRLVLELCIILKK